MKYKTNYHTAVHWLGNNFVMLNNIQEIDPSFMDNLRFELWDAEHEESVNLYSFYITDATLGNVEFLEKHFGLLFGYSELLDSYILCVPHWGTAWNYVYWETDLECAALT